jgi:hypothetical protein
MWRARLHSRAGMRIDEQRLVQAFAVSWRIGAAEFGTPNSDSDFVRPQNYGVNLRRARNNAGAARND